MTRAWVSNASPLITLAKVDRLDLLLESGAELIIPEQVAAEVLAGPRDDPARRALESGWGARLTAAAIPAEIVEWGLGKGESAVLAAAWQRPESVALLDDAEARACAAALGVPVMGTLGLILRAKRLGRIASAAEVLRSLRGAGLFIDDRVALRALNEVVGEDWA